MVPPGAGVFQCRLLFRLVPQSSKQEAATTFPAPGGAEPHLLGDLAPFSEKGFASACSCAANERKRREGAMTSYRCLEIYESGNLRIF